MHAPFHIVFASDNGCATGLGVAVFSLLEHLSGKDRCMITILDGGISEENKARIRTMADAMGGQVAFLDMTGHFAESRVDHLSKATYFRLMIAEVLPAGVERAIYADTDVLFAGDAFELFELDLDGLPLAAVADVYLMQTDGQRIRSSLGLPRGAYYFNAGVLLMDLGAWRRDGLVGKCLDYERHNRGRLLFHDQDVLNAVLQGMIKPLHPRWNMFDLLLNPVWRRRQERSSLAPYDATLFEEAAASPRIIHYSGSKKPWTYFNKCHAEALYLHYLRRSPWGAQGQTGFTCARAVKKNLRKWRLKLFSNWT